MYYMQGMHLPYMMNYVVDDKIANELNKIIIDGLMNSWKSLDPHMNNI